MSFLKTIKNLFTVEPWPSKEAFQLGRDEILIHEDDVRQIELIPAENYQYAIEEIEKIQKFADEHFDGKGWTEMYVRDEPPVRLTERRISFFSFMTPLAKDGFQLKDMRFIGSRSPVINPVLVKNNFRIFLSLEGVSIGAIYFAKGVTDRGLMINTIVSLSQTYNLILVDWWKLMVVDARFPGEVEHYLAS